MDSIAFQLVKIAFERPKEVRLQNEWNTWHQAVIAPVIAKMGMGTTKPI